MVTTRHAAGASPATTAASRRSTRKAKAVETSNAQQLHAVEPAAEPCTSTPAARRQPGPNQSSQQGDDQHKTLQHLASMLWQAMDKDEDSSSDDDNTDAIHRADTVTNGADNEALAWEPTLALDPSPLPTYAAADSSMRKEPGLAGQRRALPRTGNPSAQRTTPSWTELPAQEIDDQIKRDLRLLRLRAAYDPTRHYKTWGKGKFPKHFAFGTVVQGPGEFFTERLTRKERKATLAEQLLADQELTAARTKRFAKMQEEASHWSLRKNKRQRQAEPARKHRARSKH